MLLNLPNIIIIDDGNNERKKGIIDVFRNISEIFRYNCKINKIESDKIEKGYWKTVEGKIDFDLVLVHGSEVEFINKINVKTIIGYSGNEGHDPRFQDLVIHQIHRAITSSSDAITLTEAKEIVKFLNGNVPPPSFFFSKTYNPKLEELVDFMHNNLYFPENIDWELADDNFGHYFQDYRHAWNDFLSKVNILIKQGADLKPIDSSYHKALEELIEKTINKND